MTPDATMTGERVPLIYSPQFGPTQVRPRARLLALGVSLACLAALVVAGGLEPSPMGVGTHAGLFRSGCQWLQLTGVPCVSCGMTTSWAHFVRGEFVSSLYVQPMGMLLAGATAAAVWVGLYIGLTGRPALRLLRLVPARPYLLGLLLLGVAAWAWKITIHLCGVDGGGGW